MAQLTLRPDQQKAFEWLHGRLTAALFGDLGTGKTIVVLQLLSALKSEGAGKALLVAPKNVKDFVWQQEAKKFDCFRHLTFSTGFAIAADVHLVNPESLHKVPNWLDYETLIIDESQDFKNPGSTRFKCTANRLHLFKRRYILTAGPIPNGFIDLWSQIYILDMGLRLGKNITQYRERWFTQSYNGFGWDERPGAAEEIRARVTDIVMHIDRNEVLQLPELREVDVPVQLSQSAEILYDRLETDLAVELATTNVVALSAASCYMKCKQFTGGFLYDDDKRAHWIHMEKIHALADLHASLNYAPLLVAYQFETEGAELARRFGCPRISGSVKKDVRSDILAAWGRKELPMLVAQISTVARGLNLQFGGSDLVIYSITNVYDHYFQILGRLHRPGAVDTVTAYSLVCSGTIDEAKLRPGLKTKGSRQKSFLSSLSRHVKKKQKTRQESLSQLDLQLSQSQLW